MNQSSTLGAYTRVAGRSRGCPADAPDAHGVRGCAADDLGAEDEPIRARAADPCVVWDYSVSKQQQAAQPAA